MIERIKQAKTISIEKGGELPELKSLNEEWNWHLSTSAIQGRKVGDIIGSNITAIDVDEGFNMPIRLIGIPNSKIIKHSQHMSLKEIAGDNSVTPNLTFEQLGILESEKMSDDEKYPFVKGKGKLKEAIAICEMVAMSYQLPFKKDMVKKIFEGQFRKGKDLSLDLIAGVCEVMGLDSQLAATKTDFARSIEGPVVLFLDGICCMLWKEKENL